MNEPVTVWVVGMFVADGGGEIKGVYDDEELARADLKYWRENPEDALADYNLYPREMNTRTARLWS